MNAWFDPGAGQGAASLWIGLALVCGAVLGWTLARRAAVAQAAAERAVLEAAHAQAIEHARARQQAEADAELATLRERLRGVENELADEADAHRHFEAQAARFRDELDRLRDERSQLAERAARLPELTERLDEARAEAARLAGTCAELTARLDAERGRAHEKIALLAEAKDALTNQFRTLAADILEEKSRRFAEHNASHLGQLLDPLKSRLHEFQGRIEQLYDTEGKERSALAGQVQNLMQLNRALSDDAKNLTLALKGSSKTQGSWGELILERVLEASGLRRGCEYEVQPSHVREDGSRAQPDVVIHLPEGRRLVVDAKVSLIAWEQMVNTEDCALRAAAERRHLESVRRHIGGLSLRNYQHLHGHGASLDFVLMFVPIEPAFIACVQADGEMFMHAWNKNVLLVSPSTLLFVVRTVAHLWRQEQQSRNTQEIARRGAELYDRLVAFVDDLERVGRSLAGAQQAWADAFDKLGRNRGNVIRQAEMLKGLGLKPSRTLPEALTRRAAADGPADDGPAAAGAQDFMFGVRMSADTAPSEAARKR